jgi:hypothetical protein
MAETGKHRSGARYRIDTPWRLRAPMGYVNTEDKEQVVTGQPAGTGTMTSDSFGGGPYGSL